jgi:Zn-dependent protease with chaperone function
MPETNVNVTPTSPLREFFVLLAGVVGIIVGLYFFLGLAVNVIVPYISPGVEQKMAVPFMRSMGTMERSSENIQLLQKLLDTIQGQCAQLPYTFTVYTQESARLNAVSLPGGNIVVFTGLLKKIESENELAFVLAHEMGHYMDRDHLRGIGRALIFMMISAMLLGPDSGAGNLLVQSLNITEMAFSRNQETRADEFAVNALNCFYGHVGGATTFFDKIGAEDDTGSLGHYFSTHPESRERISHLKEYSRSKGFFEREPRSIPAMIKKISGQPK